MAGLRLYTVCGIEPHTYWAQAAPAGVSCNSIQSATAALRTTRAKSHCTTTTHWAEPTHCNISCLNRYVGPTYSPTQQVCKFPCFAVVTGRGLSQPQTALACVDGFTD